MKKVSSKIASEIFEKRPRGAEGCWNAAERSGPQRKSDHPGWDILCKCLRMLLVLLDFPKRRPNNIEDADPSITSITHGEVMGILDIQSLTRVPLGQSPG